MNYNSYDFTAVAGNGPFSHTIEGLTSGTSYFARVTAANNRGLGYAQTALPTSLAPPKQKADVPTSALLAVQSATSLKVIFNAPESDGGETVSKYKIEWDTSSSFSSGTGGTALGSYDKAVSTGDCVSSPCTHVIGSLTKGTSYYVRVYSYNSFGYSTAAASTSPLSESPKTRAAPPAVVSVSPHNLTSLAVSFAASPDNGGAPVTRYLVAWDALGQDGHAAGATQDSILYSTEEVQVIQTTSTANDLGGSFRVSFEEHSTADLSYDISADDMEAALEALPTIGDVEVSRSFVDTVKPRNGMKWTVTFVSHKINVPSLTVSTDAGATFGTIAAAGGLTGTGAKVAVSTTVTALKGFEQQTISISTSSNNLAGTFSIGFSGSETNQLAVDSSAAVVEAALEGLGNTGDLKVLRRINGYGFVWTCIFMTKLGNVPSFTLNTDLTTGTGLSSSVQETVSGVLPTMDSSLKSTSVVTAAAGGAAMVHHITGLTAGVQYHVKVSAWNGVGNSYGSTQYCTPPLASPDLAPNAPRSPELHQVSSTSLRLDWWVLGGSEEARGGGGGVPRLSKTHNSH